MSNFAGHMRGNQLTELVRQPSGTLTMLDDGSYQAIENFALAWDMVQNKAPTRNSTPHPDYQALLCTHCEVKRVQTLVATLTVTYRGLLGTTPDPVEEIIVSTSQDPIETHDKFISTLGGTPSSPLNNAKFDKNGLFLGFGVVADTSGSGTGASKYTGVTSYLTPGTIYRLTSLVGSRPTSIAFTGKIAPLPTPIDLPNQYMNWLQTSFTWKREGGLWITVADYQLSGKKGWDNVIYG